MDGSDGGPPATVAVSDPLKMLSALTSKKKTQFGNTPRPSKSEGAFFAGMHALEAGDYTEAETQLQQAVVSAESELGAAAGTKEEVECREHLAMYIHSVGYLQVCRGNLDLAEPMYRKADELWTQVHGEGHAKLLALYSDCAKFFEVKGDTDTALQYLDRCCSIVENKRGKDTRDYAGVLLAKAAVHSGAAQAEEAEACFKQGLDLQVDDATKAGVHKMYGAFLESIDRTADAEVHQKAASALRPKKSGKKKKGKKK